MSDHATNVSTACPEWCTGLCSFDELPAEPGVFLRIHQSAERASVAKLRSGWGPGTGEVTLSLVAEQRLSAAGLAVGDGPAIALFGTDDVIFSAAQARQLAAALLNVSDELEALAT